MELRWRVRSGVAGLVGGVQYCGRGEIRWIESDGIYQPTSLKLINTITCNYYLSEALGILDLYIHTNPLVLITAMFNCQSL